MPFSLLVAVGGFPGGQHAGEIRRKLLFPAALPGVLRLPLREGAEAQDVLVGRAGKGEGEEDHRVCSLARDDGAAAVGNVDEGVQLGGVRGATLLLQLVADAQVEADGVLRGQAPVAHAAHGLHQTARRGTECSSKIRHQFLPQGALGGGRSFIHEAEGGPSKECGEEDAAGGEDV